MIFNLYPKVAVKLGDERYEYDRPSLMFSDVAEIERASGMSYGEWQSELGRYSLLAIAALLHALRKREGIQSDFDTMNFAAADLDVIPLHDDGSEYTVEEVSEDLARRIEKDKPEADPTTAAAASAAGAATPGPGTTPSTSLTSPNGSASAPGNGNGSPGGSSKSSKKQQRRT